MEKKWNGKFKEYNFEGEYLNGKKQGKTTNNIDRFMIQSIPSYKDYVDKSEDLKEKDDEIGEIDGEIGEIGEIDEIEEIDELSKIDKNKCLIDGNKEKKKRKKLDDN